MIIRQQLARRAAEELPRHLVGCDEVRVLQPGDRGEEVGTLVFKDGALVVKRFFSQAPIFPIERTPFLPYVGKINCVCVCALSPYNAPRSRHISADFILYVCVV